MVSTPVTLTIDCPQDPVVINQPETITDCVNDFVVNGIANPGASITLHEGDVEGPVLGTATADANWILGNYTKCLERKSRFW